MTGHGPIRSFRRPLTDRYRIGDLAQPLALERLVTRAAHPAGLAQMLDELLLQGPTGLDEETPVDRLV